MIKQIECCTAAKEEKAEGLGRERKRTKKERQREETDEYIHRVMWIP